MTTTFTLVALGLLIVWFGLWSKESAQETGKTPVAKPAQVTVAPGDSRVRVVLTERAAQRLGIVTSPVEASPLTVPYAAVLYDPDGSTWVYTNPESLVYMRQRIEVDRIEGDRALLLSGPSPGTAVVTSGAAELLGTEFGVGK